MRHEQLRPDEMRQRESGPLAGSSSARSELVEEEPALTLARDAPGAAGDDDGVWEGGAFCAPIMKVRADGHDLEHVDDKRMGIFRLLRWNHSFPLYENDHRMYMFYWNITKEWRIGDDFKRPHAGISSPPADPLCPDKAPEWYYFHNGTWSTRFGIEIVPEECAETMDISGAEDTQPNEMGVFHITLNDTAGRPIYKNDKGMFLYYWYEFGEWRIGPDWQDPSSGVSSKRHEMKKCPVEAGGWTVFSNFTWEKADIHVRVVPRSGSHYDTYVIGPSGVNKCPEDSHLANESKCKEVAEEMHRNWAGSSVDEEQPRGCYRGVGQRGEVYYNDVEVGRANKGSHPVCLRDPDLDWWALLHPGEGGANDTRRRRSYGEHEERKRKAESESSGGPGGPHESGTVGQHGHHEDHHAANGSKGGLHGLVSSVENAFGMNSSSNTTGGEEVATTAEPTEEAHGEGHGEGHGEEKKKGGGGGGAAVVVILLVVIIAIVIWRRRKAAQAAKIEKIKEQMDVAMKERDAVALRLALKEGHEAGIPKEEMQEAAKLCAEIEADQKLEGEEGEGEGEELGEGQQGGQLEGQPEGQQLEGQQLEGQPEGDPAAAPAR